MKNYTHETCSPRSLKITKTFSEEVHTDTPDLICFILVLLKCFLTELPVHKFHSLSPIKLPLFTLRAIQI